MSLYNVSHMLKHNFFRIFEELARFDMSRVYHRSICRFSNAVSISRHLSPALYPHWEKTK